MEIFPIEVSQARPTLCSTVKLSIEFLCWHGENRFEIDNQTFNANAVGIVAFGDCRERLIPNVLILGDAPPDIAGCFCLQGCASLRFSQEDVSKDALATIFPVIEVLKQVAVLIDRNAKSNEERLGGAAVAVEIKPSDPAKDFTLAELVPWGRRNKR